ncbi:MAG TPA: hypothetical protein VNJ01_08320 [Bacteriovoracaceae bacterium]|nr:hypothetical protein [Bacteriovoracaceae bacterium]
MKGFHYNKLKSESSSNDSWGSYSDLFMVLCFVFLMMYVVSSLRSGTNSIQKHLEQQKMNRENDDLRAQIKAYDTLKDAALQDESQDEQKVYKELMDKLSLLQDEAKEEKNKLRRQAQDNEQKEKALNKYQQVIRNIIDANVLAKSKLKVREEIIDKKNVVIVDLNEEIEEKKQEIAENNTQINKINKELSKNITNLMKAQKSSKISKQKATAQINALKQQSMKKITQLNQENRQVQDQMAKINQELSQTSQQLAQTETKLVEEVQENEQLAQKLDQTVGEYQSQIKGMQEAHQQKMAQDKAQFENKLQSANMTAQEKARQLAEFNKAAQAKNEAMGSQINSLKQDLAGAASREQAKALENMKLAKEVGDQKGQIQGMEAAHTAKLAGERATFEGKLAAANLSGQEKAKQLADFNAKAKAQTEALGQEIAGLKGSLAEAQERANARAKLSKEIGAALKSVGVDADVNPNTGDVTISFGKDYFDNDSSKLKNSMAGVLKKFIPKYSESLFKDPKIASKITSVDIVGFASPTYQGKYIDPLSLNPGDQKAAKYNLDLSYQRARAIFDYMFDTGKITYGNQKQLLSMVKVTGRSFFTEGRAPAGVVPGMTQKEFCAKFDCKQAQKVIIKFNMDDKK